MYVITYNNNLRGFIMFLQIPVAGRDDSDLWRDGVDRDTCYGCTMALCRWSAGCVLAGVCE